MAIFNEAFLDKNAPLTPRVLTARMLGGFLVMAIAFAGLLWITGNLPQAIPFYLAFMGLLALLALIIGCVAYRYRSPDGQPGKWMMWVQLVIGILFLAIGIAQYIIATEPGEGWRNTLLGIVLASHAIYRIRKERCTAMSQAPSGTSLGTQPPTT